MARILFLQEHWTENLGVMYLSAVARAEGHECRLIVENRKPRDREIRDYAPDLIAFSIMTGSHKWAVRRAGTLRRNLNVLIVFGGPHATYYPEIIEEPAVDVICRGEGELAFREILHRLDTGAGFRGIPNTWRKDGDTIEKNDLANLVEDLDSLPIPDRELYYRYPFFRNNENKSFISGRGCPFSCTYCSIASLRDLYAGKGRFVRFHSPERVVEEILQVSHDYGLKTVIFQDDTFIVGPERLAELMALYRRKVHIPFVCHIRADLVTDEIARILKDAGCHSVDFGLESGDEALRTKVLGKTVTDDQIRSAAATLKKHRIRFRTTNMFGLPGETLDQALRTVRLNQEIGTDYPSASVYQPYPRTKLGDQVIAAGLAGSEHSVDNLAGNFFRTSVLDIPHRNAFINLQKLFWPAVKFPRLTPLIRKLINLPPNPVFEMMFLFFYAINYMLSEKVSVKRVLNLGLHTAHSVFFGK